MPQNKANTGSGYECWLRYETIDSTAAADRYRKWCGSIVVHGHSPMVKASERELTAGLTALLGERQASEGIVELIALDEAGNIDPRLAGVETAACLKEDGYVIRALRQEGGPNRIVLAGKTGKGVLYAVFHLLRLLQCGQSLETLDIAENPKNGLRMINHWDNMNGSVERGYAGKSIFYKEDRIVSDLSRIRDYARLLASIGLNAVSINNVNVHRQETMLVTEPHLKDVARVAGVFREYGIRTFLSINFASPIQIGGLVTADPLDPGKGGAHL